MHLQVFYLLASIYLFHLLYRRIAGVQMGGYSRIVLVVIASVALLVMWKFTNEERRRAPHLVRTHIGTQVLSEFTTTNPAYVTFEIKQLVTSNGLETVQVPKTNFYW